MKKIECFHNLISLTHVREAKLTTLPDGTSKVVHVINPPKSKLDCIDRLHNSWELRGFIYTPDQMTKDLVELLYDSKPFVYITEQHLYHMNSLIKELTETRDSLETEDSELYSLRLKTIDRHIYKLKYTSIYFGRALSDGTSFSSLNTEFDRILPEHIVFYVTHVKTVQHLINLIEWKRKKLRTGGN